MALTKVSALVSEISKLLFGTTKVEIASSGGPIDIDVAGINVVDITTTEVTLDALVTLITDKIISETILIGTPAGADARLATSATETKMGGTTSFPVEILQNNIPRLTIGTDGKITLDIQGTATNQLIDKAYVDAAAPDPNTVTVATNGQIIFPNPGGDDIIVKWGVKTGSGSRTITFADDTAAFPNAISTVLATPQNTGSANSDGWWGVESLATTGFVFNSANRGSYGGSVNWIAIGS
jgi:hypothetical protein